jgi:uncharacterized protein (DUF983 family)
MSKRVRCGTCWTAYDRSTFQGFTQERGSFDCHACGAELERWETNLVPTYSVAAASMLTHEADSSPNGPAWPD